MSVSAGASAGAHSSLFGRREDGAVIEAVEASSKVRKPKVPGVRLDALGNRGGSRQPGLTNLSYLSAFIRPWLAAAGNSFPYPLANAS